MATFCLLVLYLLRYQKTQLIHYFIGEEIIHNCFGTAFECKDFRVHHRGGYFKMKSLFSWNKFHSSERNHQSKILNPAKKLAIKMRWIRILLSYAPFIVVSFDAIDFVHKFWFLSHLLIDKLLHIELLVLMFLGYNCHLLIDKKNFRNYRGK